ncbi:MAG: hypothetical protein KC478_07525 [Bacteriovoracaceae bacterium]|nr:hypothetical protein [Bacteriovoracaceae bacterium]
MTLVLSLSLYVSCNKKQDEPIDEFNPSRGNQYSSGGENSKCRSIKAVHILKDGNTVISRLNESSWLAWRLDNKEVKASGLNLNYFEASHDGRFQLSRISNGKYQLMELSNGGYIRNSFLQINSIDKPIMHFSENSKFIVVRYRPYNSWGTDYLSLYNIETQTFTKSFKAKGIKFVRVLESESTVVVGYDTGLGKFIKKHKLDSFEELFHIDLPYYKSFRSLDIAGDRIVAKSGLNYAVFSTHDGTKVFEEDYKHIYELDNNSGLALVAHDWGEVAVIDLNDGREVYSGKSPKEVVLSSCRLKTNPLRAVCRASLEQNKIFKWGLENGENSLTCY